MPIAINREKFLKNVQWMDDQSRMRNFYGLRNEGIAIVKYLFQSGNMVDESKLNEILSQEGIESDYLECLIKKRFIRVALRQRGKRYFALTDEARQAFEHQEPFGIVHYEDHFYLLKNYAFKNISDVKNFYYSLSLTTRETILRDGAEKLKLKQMTEQQQLEFWRRVHHFLNNPNDPYPVDEDEQTSRETEDALITLGLLENVCADSFNENSAESNGCFLSRRVVAALFHGHDELINYKAISKVATIIKSESIKPCKLFYAKETQEEIDSLRKMLSSEGFARASKILIRQNNNPAIISLLWGPPGTGKTEIIKQLARESGRDVILFDVSKVTATAWGATERLYRTLFRNYSYITAVCSLPPILLMNEADAILGKRLQSIERAIDKGENNVSNILLQEFEDLSGILLATTNLVDNLDEAFDRRFLFKTEIGLPDQAARESIWKAKIPELKEMDAKLLAEQYLMTGGQINNVVAKRNLAELYFEGERGLTFIQELCEKELSISRRSGHTKSTKIGF